MKDGQGFARRVTVGNLEQFSPLLQKTSLATERSPDETPKSPAGLSTDEDTAKYREAEKFFAGKSLRVELQLRRPVVSKGGASKPKRDGGNARAVRPSQIDEADNTPVLLAEIPAGGGRWKQANFDLSTYKQFFEADPHSQTTITLTHVQADGTLDTPEVHPTVAVKSQNYRVELNAAAGLPYPPSSQERPIAVFIRIRKQTHLYRLLMPGNTDYALVNKYLRENKQVPTGKMRRLQISVAQLQHFWPHSPLLKPYVSARSTK